MRRQTSLGEGFPSLRQRPQAGFVLGRGAGNAFRGFAAA